MVKSFKNCLLIFLVLIWIPITIYASANSSVQIARLKYSGGGDWYASPTSLPNLIEFCNRNLGTNIHPREAVVEAGSPDIFNYPLIHITGHGNIIFSDHEAENLRKYLKAGGFLNINDSYGMDPYIRSALKKVLPDMELTELPFNHPIYHQTYSFPNGLPKIHEHDGKPPQGFGIYIDGRLSVFYSYEADIGDGWEDEEVHGDTPEVRLKALQMGANIIEFVFNQKK